MIKLGVNSVLFQSVDLATAMKHIAWAGYDGVELSALKGMSEHLVLDDWEAQVDEIRSLSDHFNAETNRDAIMTGSLVMMGISR